MPSLIFLTHPEVHIDPQQEITQWSLSPIGRQRVESACQSGLFDKIDVIFSSHEIKARETAEIISHYLKKNFMIFPGLEENDRSSTGYLPREEFAATVKEWFAHPNENTRGWESPLEVQKRVVEAISQITAVAPDQNILISSHGGAGALYKAFVLQKPIAQEHEQIQIGSWFEVDIFSGKLIKDWTSLS